MKLQTTSLLWVLTSPFILSASPYVSDNEIFGDKVIVFSPKDEPSYIADKIREVNDSLFGKEITPSQVPVNEGSDTL